VKYIVEVNGTRLDVELDGSRATVNGRTVEVQLTSIPGTPVRLLRVDEEVHRVVTRRGPRRGAWRIDVDGVAYATEALSERMRTLRDLTEAAVDASGPAPLLAPMPGMVVRVSVVVGDLVTAGQGLAVVEAMKMENELRAVAAGVVTAVRAVAGMAVEKGAVLVELGPVPSVA
jgi:pyruvate carboxylase subunit B